MPSPLAYDYTRNGAPGDAAKYRRNLERHAGVIAYRLVRDVGLPIKMKARAHINDDVKWAYSFADKPRKFFKELFEFSGEKWDGPDWLPWRSFISTVFGEPFESDEEEQIFFDCTDRREKPTSRPNRIWMPVGRRGGKSRIFAAIAVFLGCCYDWSHFLSPGEFGVLPVLAADRRQARVIMGYVKAFLEHPRLKERVVNDSAESILLEGNILIEVVTASFKAVRSRTVIAALCDEIAFWENDEASANPDTEIINALEPSMITIPNALLLGASSPYAKRGVLWDNFEKYYGKDEGPLVWRAATWVMHPELTRDHPSIVEKFEEDPVAATAEYGAEFRSDVDRFITREVLDPVIMQGIQEIPPQPSTQYFAFVDPSGGSSDSMTLSIGHIDKETRRGVQDVLRERRPPFSPESVVEEFAETLRAYRIHRIRGDRYAGEWPRERFRIKGIAYEISKKRKSDIYVGFLPILNAARCELLDNPRNYNQLLGLDRRISRGGRESIDHAPGSHDDLANVTSGLMEMMLGRKDTLTVDPGLLARSARVVTPGRLVMTGPRWG